MGRGTHWLVLLSVLTQSAFSAERKEELQAVVVDSSGKRSELRNLSCPVDRKAPTIPGIQENEEGRLLRLVHRDGMMTYCIWLPKIRVISIGDDLKCKLLLHDGKEFLGSSFSLLARNDLGETKLEFDDVKWKVERLKGMTIEFQAAPGAEVAAMAKPETRTGEIAAVMHVGKLDYNLLALAFFTRLEYVGADPRFAQPGGPMAGGFKAGLSTEFGFESAGQTTQSQMGAISRFAFTGKDDRFWFPEVVLTSGSGTEYRGHFCAAAEKNRKIPGAVALAARTEFGGIIIPLTKHEHSGALAGVTIEIARKGGEF